jgi:hypothetical protein
MIIVNFSTKEYAKGQQRLNASIKGYKTLMFDSYEQIDSPSHQISPYAFKVYAIKKALEIDPIVLWADASLWRVGDLSIIENIIKTEGFFGTEAGHYSGKWTNDHTRKYFNVTEQEMYQGQGGITLLSAGLLGLDKNNEIAMEFLRQWEASCSAGCFSGSWLDHRHDQTCASIIATRLGLKYQRGGQHLAYVGPGYSKPEKDVVFLCQGIQ